MAAISGYGLTPLSGTISLNLAKSQSRLQTDVSRLSSGLRINSAADDPSGLAIAERLESKVNGYDQASANVQTANNMLTVADGALQTVTNILQRLRNLAVEANDDLLSDADRADIQAESTQLQAEINTISENTTFNGIHLLNRNPHSAVAATVADSTFTIPSVGGGGTYAPGPGPWTFSPFLGDSGAGIVATNILVTYDNGRPPPSGSPQVAELSGGAPDTLQALEGQPSFSQAIPGFKADEKYALSFNVAQWYENSQTGRSNPQQVFAVIVDGSTIGTYQPIPPDPANPDWTRITTSTFSPGAGTHTISFQGLGEGGVFIDNVQMAIIPSPQLQGPPLHVQDGADEGNALAVELPTVFTSNLGIGSNTVVDSVSAATYETNIDAALGAVVNARATLGAQMDRLQYQASNNDTASVNLQASESDIRDANVAQETTTFAQEQILSSIGTSVLANIKTQASLVERLFQ